MAWQKYPVSCECGIVHEVSAGSAGSTFACACGKAVEVPSLVRLKASVGKAAVSADFELDQMIGSGGLPVEDTCGVCGAETTGLRHVVVVCERSEGKKERTTLGTLTAGLLVGVVSFGLLRYSPGRESDRKVGRDVAYRLPIRVCPTCADGRWTKELTRTVLERTPLYARLLDKYPDATIGLPG